MRDRLGLSDTKNIRNWKNGVSKPASSDAYASLRAELAKAQANTEHLPALDAAFARAQGSAGTPPPPPAEKRPKVWRTGKTLDSIHGWIEFRLRLGSNAGPDEETCPVQAVLLPGQLEREVDGHLVLLGFRHLSLAFDAPDHVLLEETVLGSDDRPAPAGVVRVPGGWRLVPGIARSRNMA